MRQVGKGDLRILSLFQKRIDGDDSLLQLADLRFAEAGLGTEYYAETEKELARLLGFRPARKAPAVVHLRRGIDLFDESDRRLIMSFAGGFKDSVFGLVVHDQPEIAVRMDDYSAVLEGLESALGDIPGSPYLFIEYAAALGLETYIDLFKKIRELKRVSACIDIGHIGLRQARDTYALRHPGKDVCAVSPDDPYLPELIGDIEVAVHSSLGAVLHVIQELGRLGKPLHFHLHDGHPLSASSHFGVSDHISFLDRIPIPFEYKGRRSIDAMFGPSGLSKIITEALQFGTDHVSFSLEIHPTEGRRPLGNASYLFNHWRDLGNAERMNFWLSVINKNHRLLLKSCGIEKGPDMQTDRMIIYNLFPLLAGKFKYWERHFSRASEMGFTWVFINPVQRTGASGSLYSIADYFDLNPALVDSASEKAPVEQLKEAVKAAEGLGLKVMIDLVINHCSADSGLIKSHPEWFLREPDGRVSHPFAYENGKKVVWRDLAKFDHRNTKDREGLLRFFLEIVKFLMGLGFAGFRCDAAYQVPKSLWERLIGEARKINPGALFFAETLGSTPDRTAKTAAAGFDYIFNSSKWWDFYSSWLMKQYILTRDIADSISFPESHDTLRLFEELNGSIEGLKQRYLFSALFSAGVMMPMGFEFGFRKRLHVVGTRPEDWEETGLDLTSFITKVNRIKAENVIFQEDSPTEIIPCGNPDVLLMWKASTNTKEESLVILNKDIHNRQHFYAENLLTFFHAKAPLMDISPEYAMDYIPVPFSYDLRPGQGIVLVTSREEVLEED